MSRVYNSTQTFEFDREGEYIVANAPSSTGTLALEYAVGNEWALAGTIAAGEAKVLKVKYGGSIRLSVTGSVNYTLY